MKRILLLATGGTISCEESDDGLVPHMQKVDFARQLGAFTENYDIEVRNILCIDSSNMQQEDWQVIAQSIFDEAQHFDGIIVSHGTDTMAYTAAVLSFMLPSIPLPVVLTGSQVPLNHALTDGVENLRVALAMASSGHAGIFVAFNRAIILGTRAVKVRTVGFNAFESVNYPYIGNVDAHGLTVNEQLLIKPSGDFKLLDRLSPDVFLLKLTPGLNPQILEMLCQMKYKGVVIEAFGAGGIQFLRRDLMMGITKMVDSGISVVICSQCLYEQSDLTIYEAGRRAVKAGAISAGDMTTEAAMTKLMWALGQSQETKFVREVFNKNLAGETRLYGRTKDR